MNKGGQDEKDKRKRRRARLGQKRNLLRKRRLDK